MTNLVGQPMKRLKVICWQYGLWQIFCPYFNDAILSLLIHCLRIEDYESPEICLFPLVLKVFLKL